MDERPQARIEGIVTERVGDELVIYDQASRAAHSLSPNAASVWDRCDGQRSPEEISIDLGVEPTIVSQALKELGDCGLLNEGPTAEHGYSRREAALRFARVGGAAFAAPLIYSVAIGPATAAASTCTATGSQQTTGTCSASAGGFGTSSGTGHCCSGACYGGQFDGTFWCVASPTPTCNGRGGPCQHPSDCCDKSNTCLFNFCFN